MFLRKYDILTVGMGICLTILGVAGADLLAASPAEARGKFEWPAGEKKGGSGE